LADHRDGAAGIEMRGDFGRGAVVEIADRITVAVAVRGHFGGDRVEQGQFDDFGAQVLRCDGARMTFVSRFGEVCDHVGFAERAHCFQRHQFRIARSDADADEFSGAHRPALANALTAAAVMALPPMRPRTTMNGTPRGSAASASFDSAAPTKPTGMPRIAAGFGAPASSNSSRRNSAVGALPMATTAPANFSPQSSMAAAERVVPSFSASAGTRASWSV